MTDDRLGDLLRETADEIVPGDRLHAIRAATTGRGRRTAWGWWAVGGAGLVAASVVTALALTTGTPPSSDPDPATSTSPTESTAEPTSPDSPTTTEPEASTVAVYYVGDTPDGPRLYREFRRVGAADPFGAAIAALSLVPVDPDYTNLWPADAIQAVSFDGIGDDGIIGVNVDPAYRQRPVGMSEIKAGLAVEQVIRTFQAASQSRAAVQFYAGSNPIDQVLGVPTAEPLAQGSDLAVLAHVSLSDPGEGVTIDNDEPFTVTGVGNSYEGNIVTRIERLDGSQVLEPMPTIAGTYEDRLFPFEVTFDLTDVAPDDYLVTSQTDDPTGEGRFHVDTRRITLVD